VLLSLALAGGLTACKPTDFFTEVVITPFAETVDENNPTKTIVNSPDATEESASLTALAWTDESPQSVEVENLVTYSDAPTSTLTTHHSIYDLRPLFPGIEASDAVHLVFESEAELDHESKANEQDTSASNVASRSVGGAESNQSGEVASSESASSGNFAGAGEAGEEAGGSEETGDEPGGNAPSPDEPGSDEGPADNPDGPTENPSGGYNGEVKVYNPNDGFARVNRVEHLAVLGNDVAVMAQSLGGAGAICAMNEYAYYGLDAQGQPPAKTHKTYSSFNVVFGGELFAGFEQNALLWSGDGSSPASVKDIDALVSACGQGGVIIYDQKMGNAETLFSLEQRQRLQAAEIQLVPVDMSTVQGMLDAAQVIGEALSQSSECAQDAPALAREYINTVHNIVRSVTAANGGSLAALNAAGGTLLTAYNSPPVSSFRYWKTYGYIATDSESGLSFTQDANLDVSDVVLFGNNSAWMDTPLSFWMQAAGVWDRTTSAGVPGTGLTLFWPSSQSRSLSMFGGGKSGGALTRWLGSPVLGSSARAGNVNSMIGELLSVATHISYWGLGSSQIPYLIVCASDGKAAAQVKDAVVTSMMSYEQRTVLTPYSVLPYRGFFPTATVGDTHYSSVIGVTNGTTSESPFYMELEADDVVRENPTGLLSSWTEGNMESVLEAIWLADVYSSSPQGCNYSPVTNMDSFTVSIGGETCKTVKEAVLQFYTTFYRCDASGVYGAIVTDEGL
jgi:hypothetical protein